MGTSQPFAPSHGENRGSSPLGSANQIKYLHRALDDGHLHFSNFSPNSNAGTRTLGWE